MKLANEPTSRSYEKHDFLAHHTFSFQGGLSFKEWIVLDGCSFDSKPLMLESYSKMKDNIVGGLTSHKTNGSHHRTS